MFSYSVFFHPYNVGRTLFFSKNVINICVQGILNMIYVIILKLIHKTFKTTALGNIMKFSGILNLSETIGQREKNKMEKE